MTYRSTSLQYTSSIVLFWLARRVASRRVECGVGMADRGFLYGNGCQHHADCFTCPEPDCVVDEEEISRRLAPLLPQKGTLPAHEVESKPRLCKYCGGSRICRYGTVKGVRRYFCHDCKRKFTSKDNLFHMKVPHLFVEIAQSLRAQNLLYREIVRYLQEHYGYSPSVSSVHRWVRRTQSERSID